MKIILLTSSMAAGGAERVAATLSNRWSDMGYNVILLPTYSGRGECFYKIHHLTRLIFLADLVGRVRINGLVGYIKRVLALRRFIEMEKPDVLVSFLTNVNVTVLLSTLGLGIRTIICERTAPFEMTTSCPLRL